MRNAAGVAHAQYLASGATLNSARLAGKSLELKNGYPDASRKGIGNMVDEYAGFSARANAESVTFLRAEAPSGELCAVTFRAAQPSVAATLATVVTIGC